MITVVLPLPVAPVEPVAPVDPVAPVEPVAPAGPGTGTVAAGTLTTVGELGVRSQAARPRVTSARAAKRVRFICKVLVKIIDKQPEKTNRQQQQNYDLREGECRNAGSSPFECDSPSFSARCMSFASSGDTGLALRAACSTLPDFAKDLADSV